MGREFASRHDAQVPATPEQVWDAIATGPGISSWFIGRTEIDGGTVRTAFGEGWIPAGQVTASDPPTTFGYRSDTAPDGRFLAHEYLVEGRAGASTVLRAVTSGFLPGDDWAAEYEAMTYGTEMFFHTLVEYLTHFRGRVGVPVTAFGPPVTDWDATWARLHAELGLTGAPAAGDRARVRGADGVVYFTNPHTLGVRTPDTMYRFIRGLHGSMIAAHEHFTTPPAGDTTWQAWLTDLDRKDPS
jgi:uncharacterized protein YndB with AHSA1/START domain